MGGKKGVIFLSVFVILLIIFISSVSAACTGSLNCGAISTSYYGPSAQTVCSSGFGTTCTWTGSACVNKAGASCSLLTSSSCSAVGCTPPVTPTCTSPCATETRWTCSGQKIIIQQRTRSCSGNTCSGSWSSWSDTTTYQDCNSNTYFCKEGYTSTTTFGCGTCSPTCQTNFCTNSNNCEYNSATGSTTTGICIPSCKSSCTNNDYNNANGCEINNEAECNARNWDCGSHSISFNGITLTLLCGGCPGGQTCTSAGQCVNTCTDTDGSNVNTRGTVTVGTSTGTSTYTDSCPTSTDINEYTCSGTNMVVRRSTCSDGNVCTADTCSNGACKYTAISNCCTSSSQCNDGNSCTTDSCNTATHTCTHTAIVCGDPNNKCTIPGTCGSSGCSSPTNVNCNDGKACTTDSCSYSTGCVHTENCATGYSCSALGTCVQDTPTFVCGDGDIAGTETCDDDNTVAGDGCSGTNTNPDCLVESGWTCTGEPSICKKNNGGSCTNGDQCVSDYCVAGVCASGCGSNGAQCSRTGTSYTSYGICASGTCDTSGAARVSGTYYSSCSGRADNTEADINSLAGGFSVSGYCCSGAFSSTACCTSHASSSCYNNDVYWYNSCGALEERRTDCSGSTPYCLNGACVACTSASQCNDGNTCTSDICSSSTHTCSNPSISGCCTSASQCNDGNTCTSDICSSSTHTCSNPSISGCCTSASQCNDGNGCTTDRCTSNVCTHVYDVCSSSQSCISGSCTTCAINSVSISPTSGIDDGESVTISVSTNSACNGKTVNLYIRNSGGNVATLNPITISSGSGSRSWTTSVSSSGNYYARATLSVNSGITRDSSNVYITYTPPVSCGDGICGSGETCTSCSSDCKCSSSQVCQSGVCVTPCDLNNAYWSTSNSVSGQSVSLTARGTNCDGKTITFEVRKDNTIGTEYVATPSSRTMSSGTATTSWTTIAPFSGDSTPTYYFIARESTSGDSFDSRSGSGNDRLDVTIPLNCGNSVLNAGETCDDGDTSSGDGCSSSCTIESGWTCDNSPMPSQCWRSCGDGTLDSGETCDDGDTSSGDGCSSTCQVESGWTCTGEPSSCILCAINSVSISPTSGIDNGESVTISVSTNSACNGKTVNLYIRNSGGNVATLNPITISSGSGSRSWTTSVSSSGNYYARATLSVNSGITRDSSNVYITYTPTINCGNAVLNSGETCDDADSDSGDGCSSLCLIESGWECDNSPMPSQCWRSCGDGTLDSGETCDDGDTSSGDGCSSTCQVESGWTCDNSPMPSQCENVDNCVISSASWGDSIVENGESVYLNILTANCDNGEVISLIVREDDTGLLDPDDDVRYNPSNVVVNNNMATGTWTAEWPDLNGETDPEYYFIARILSQGSGSDVFSSNLLNVVEGGSLFCIGKGSCNDYNTQEDCVADTCSLGKASAPSGTTCGTEFDEESRCLMNTDCGCSWSGSSCVPMQDTSLTCGECGNGIKDFGEQCDDGNLDNLDGCSNECEFEDGILPPCPEGTTLCKDNTCSLNCLVTDEDLSNCNYNGICDTGEGCNCADCDNELDTCIAGLLCSLENLACCDLVIDGICNPICSSVDPDCENNNVECGNGLKEFGEECDDGNVVSEDGCSMICQYETLPGPPDAPCPEGTILCSDGTCSLNCWFTDQGYGNCTDSSCCAAGLIFSMVDLACCNVLSNDICNPYCSYIDPDCSGAGKISISSIGQCTFTKNNEDNCDDGFLTRDYTAKWQWDSTNVFFTNPNPSNNRYVEDAEISGIWHYDPININGVRKSEGCQGIHDTIPCPAQIKLDAFGKVHLIIAFLLIGIIYTVIIFKKRK